MQKYICKKLRHTQKLKGIKHWVVVFGGGDEYDVNGTFADVKKLCDEVGEHPVYVSCEYDYPIKTSEWELMKQLKAV